MLDTSTILHDWRVLANEGDKVVPMRTLEELEKFLPDGGELGENARHALQYIERNGVSWKRDGDSLEIWDDVEQKGHADAVVETAEKVSARRIDSDVVLVTNSISVKAKASARGIPARMYDDVGGIDDINGWSDQSLSDEDLQYIFQRRNDEYLLPCLSRLQMNEYVVPCADGERCSGTILRHVGGGVFRNVDMKPHLCGVVPRSLEQAMFADALLDDSIPLVTAVGLAGSGKSLLAIAAAMQKVLNERRYNKIVITRPIMPIGRDIGFLPGSVEEKMAEWIRPFTDNISYIRDINSDKGKRKVAAEKIGALLDLQGCKDTLEILPITYIRGSSISNAFIIVDEAQNATPSEMKTIVTRVGENSKMVVMGDVSQIDNRFLTSDCNGLALAVKKFRDMELSAHVSLKSIERSPLARMAAQVLF